jgi:hypothetical protein
MPLVAYEHRPAVEVERAPGYGLPLGAEALRLATGWEVKPQGVCRGDVCVPLAGGGATLERDGALDLVGFAGLLGQPVAHDPAADAWAFGHPAPVAASRGVAPDVELPDLDGQPHTLAGHRGTKVLLLAWSSW